MKKFLAIYLGSASGRSEWTNMDEAKRKKLEASGIKAWGDWMTTHKAAIAEPGGPAWENEAYGCKRSYGYEEQHDGLCGRPG